MAKATLSTSYKDDVLASAMSGSRRYKMISNDDGTVSFQDATTYTQTGSTFGASVINATNTAVNESADKANIIDSLSDVVANTTSGKMAGALAVKELNSNLRGHLLYNNETGLRCGGTATLSDDINNYNYLEAYFGNDIYSTDIYPQGYSKTPVNFNGSTLMRLLFLGMSKSNPNIEQLSRAVLDFSDNKVIFKSERYINFETTAGTVKVTSATNYHMILFRVVGIK